MDAAIKESKEVIRFLKEAATAYNLIHEKKTNFAKVSKIFLDSAEINDNIIYCLASVNTVLAKSSKKIAGKIDRYNNNFTASLIYEPNQEEIDKLKTKYNFLCSAHDLYISIPDYTPYFEKLI